MLNDLGFGVAFINSFFNYPKKWPIIWKQLHYYLLLWAVVFSLLVAILILLIIPAGAAKDQWLLIGIHAVTYILFNPAIIVGTKYYQFAQKPLFIMWAAGAAGITTVFLTLYTIAYLKMGYMGWFVSIFAGSLVQFLFFVYPVYVQYRLGPLFRFRKRFLKKQLRLSLPTIPHGYSAILLNSSDRIVMDRVQIGTPVIGRYNLAYTIGSYFEFFGNAIGQALAPIYTSLFSRRTKPANDLVFYLTRYLQFGFLLLGCCLALWAKEIFRLLIANNSLEDVYPLGIIIIMSYVCRPYYWNVINRLQFNEQTVQLWKISLIAGVGNLVLNIIFIPLYGITAAAITTFICIMYMGFAGFFLPAFKQADNRNYQPVPAILIIVAATVLVYLLKDIAVPVKAMLTLAGILLFGLYSYRNRALLHTSVT